MAPKEQCLNEFIGIIEEEDDELSLLDMFDLMFDQQIDDFHQMLLAIRHAGSDAQLKQAVEEFYINLSIEDGKLSSDGRITLKSILVEQQDAVTVLSHAMHRGKQRKYSEPIFFRRACACLTYLARDGTANLTLVEAEESTLERPGDIKPRLPTSPGPLRRFLP